MLEKLLEKVLLSRFEPLETLMAVHQFFVGVLLLLPDNQNLFVFVDDPAIKLILGALMVLFAVAHLVCLAFKDWELGYIGRRTGTLFTFMSYSFLAIAKMQTRGVVARFDWTAFLFIALTAAIMHLSLWYRRISP